MARKFDKQLMRQKKNSAGLTKISGQRNFGDANATKFELMQKNKFNLSDIKIKIKEN